MCTWWGICNVSTQGIASRSSAAHELAHAYTPRWSYSFLSPGQPTQMIALVPSPSSCWVPLWLTWRSSDPGSMRGSARMRCCRLGKAEAMALSAALPYSAVSTLASRAREKRTAKTQAVWDTPTTLWGVDDSSPSSSLQESRIQLQRGADETATTTTPRIRSPLDAATSPPRERTASRSHPLMALYARRCREGTWHLVLEVSNRTVCDRCSGASSCLRTARSVMRCPVRPCVWATWRARLHAAGSGEVSHRRLIAGVRVSGWWGIECWVSLICEGVPGWRSSLPCGPPDGRPCRPPVRTWVIWIPHSWKLDEIQLNSTQLNNSKEGPEIHRRPFIIHHANHAPTWWGSRRGRVANSDKRPRSGETS